MGSHSVLSLTLRTIPVGSCAIWSGIGIVRIAVIRWIVNRQSLDGPAVTGITLILAGVLVIQLFPKTAGHRRV